MRTQPTHPKRAQPSKDRPATATVLRECKQRILERWLERVRSGDSTMVGAPTTALVHDLPVILDGLADHLLRQGSANDAPFVTHADMRHLWSEFTPPQLREEYRQLRHAILETLDARCTLTSDERDRIVD